MKLDLKLIESRLTYSGNLAPRKIELFDTLPSTNTYLKTLSPEKIKAPIHICLAEEQSAGYGQQDRKWVSPAAENIYLSCRWQKNNLNNINGLSVVVGLSVISALNNYGVENIKIKWPNDIFWQDQKLAGVLIEISHNAIIIGIGLNVNMAESHMENIHRQWTSLEKILGATQDRNKIAGLLINNLLNYLELFDNNNLNYFMSEWNKSDYLLNKKINLDLNLNTNKEKNTISGIAKGIDEKGFLLLEEENGEINKYSTGSITLSP